MPFKFNPFSGNFDQTGSGGGGASYIDGEVATYADLPLDGTAALNSAWLVRNASGVWPVSRKQAGIYIRTATAGSSRDADYTYAGTMPDVFSDAQFTLYDDADTSKNLKFQLSGLATGTTSTLTVPASGTIARLSDIPAAFDPASPGTIGATTPAAATFTNLTANTRVNLPNTNGTTAGDLYRNANTLRYRDSTNTERLLLNASDNLSNLASAATSRANLGVGSSDAVTFGSIQNTPIGSTTASSVAATTLSAAPAAGSALTLAGGTVTASAPLIDATQTWNNAAVTFTGLRLNATNTASASGSLLMDLQTGGTTQFSVRRDGGVSVGNYYRFTGLNSGLFVHSAGGGVISLGANPDNWMTLSNSRMQLTGDLSLGRALSAGQSADTILARDAANTVAQVNGTNAQTYRLYSTFTSTTNFERLNVIAQAVGSFIIGTEKGSGGGTARGLELRTDNTARLTFGASGTITLNTTLAADAQNISTDTTTGTKIGTGTTQKIGFFNATPVVQQAAVADATDAASTQARLNDLLARLRTLGLIAT